MTRDKFKVYNGVFDEKTLRVLETLKRKKYFDELGKPIKTGKEADVYFAYKFDLKNNIKKKFAIKIYRVTSSNFKKISTYILRDYRFRNVKGNLRKIIFFWVEKEFKNLKILDREKISVPKIYKQLDNCILMNYVEGGMLKDIHIDEPKIFFKNLLFEIEKMLIQAKLIHADLSAFNVLVENQKPVLIDFGQAIKIKDKDDFEISQVFLKRDIENVVLFFNKNYNLKLNSEKIFEGLKGKLFLVLK